MQRILAFGDSFIVGDLDDFGPDDVNYNPKFPPTHGMRYEERLEYLKYNISFVSIIAQRLNKELLNFASRGSSNFNQLDQLIFFISSGNLKPDDIIMFGITTTYRDRFSLQPMVKNTPLHPTTLDLIYVLSVLDSISKKYEVPIIKFNLFDNPLIELPISFNFDFSFKNYLGWDLKANTLSDIINDTWGDSITKKYSFHTQMKIKEGYEQFWTWNRHPSVEGHKKLANWFLNNVDLK
jgi:hypothetical protein